MNFDQPPRKIIHYPIRGDPLGGSLYIYGNANAKNIALMSAGFPDSQKPFIPLGSRLAKETDTLVGIACFPGFDNTEKKPWKEHKQFTRDGYNFDEVVACFREAAKVLREESTCATKAKFTGIFHDWAASVGSMWANRAIEDGSENAPDELVYFDVVSNPHPLTRDMPPADEKDSIRQVVINKYYTYVFAFAFAAQCYVADVLAIAVFILGMIPLVVLKIGPTGKIDEDSMKLVGESNQPSISHMIYMSYPYFHLYIMQRGVLDDTCTLPQDLSKVPVLYMYGTEKAGKFHTEQSIKVLQRETDEKTSKSMAVAVDGAGHYLYLQKPDKCFDCMVKFMKED